MARAVFPIDGRGVDVLRRVGALDAARRAELRVQFVDRLDVRLAERAAVGERNLVVDLPEAIVDEEEVALRLALATDPHERFAVAIRVFSLYPGRVVAGGRVLELDEAAAERELGLLAFVLHGGHLGTDARLAQLLV